MIARARLVECINSEEIKCTKMTDIESESKVCGMHKKSKMELRSAIMIVVGES